jgi:hypothetical protein
VWYVAFNYILEAREVIQVCRRHSFGRDLARHARRGAGRRIHDHNLVADHADGSVAPDDDVRDRDQHDIAQRDASQHRL